MSQHLVSRGLKAFLPAILALAAGAAQSTCASSVAGLREMLDDRTFPLSWEETGMSDGRPLLVSIDDRSGDLFISFVKIGEGLLAEGPARVCRLGERLEARFHEGGLQLGDAASLILKAALRGGVAVGLQRTGQGRLRIGTFGWAGDFVPRASSVGLRTTYGSF